MYFGDLTLLGLVAVIFVGWALFTLLYMKKVLSKKQVILVVAILSVVGIPLGYYLWSIWYVNLGPTIFFGSIAMLCSSFIMFLVLGRGGTVAPKRAAAAPPTSVGVERPVPTIQKVDEDVVRLKVEKTATESALKSLEAAVKEGAITKDTFEKHKATYTERLKKIDSELSKRTKVDVAKLESDIEKVRKSYLDKLKGLSKKAIPARPAPVVAPKVIAAPVKAAPPVVAPAKEAPARAPEPSMKLPAIPRAPREEEFEVTPPPARIAPGIPKAPQTPAQPIVSAAPAAATAGQATIADLRREMMDELNRLKRLIGRAEA